MLKSPSKAIFVKVKFEVGKTGLIYATSDDLSSLFVVDRDGTEVRKKVTASITDIFLANGEDTIVSEIESDIDLNQWVVIKL